MKFIGLEYFMFMGYNVGTIPGASPPNQFEKHKMILNLDEILCINFYESACNNEISPGSIFTRSGQTYQLTAGSFNRLLEKIEKVQS